MGTTTTPTTASLATTATFAATTAIASTATATEFATTLTTATSITTEVATATTTTSATTLARGRCQHAVTIELYVDLLLAGAFTLSLTGGGGYEILLALTVKRGTLGEVLAAALVGLADVLSGKRGLLSLLGKVGSVRLAPILRLGLRVVLGLGVFSHSLFFLGLGHLFASLLVSQFGISIVSTPAVSNLLLRVRDAGSAVTVVGAGSSTTSTTSTAAAATALAATVVRGWLT